LALNNLRLAYGDEKTASERRSIAMKSFMNMGHNLMDFFRMRLLLEKDPRSLVEIEGLEHMEKAVAEGRGAVLLTAHLGSWELMATAAACLGFRLTALVSSIGDPTVDEFMKTVRESCGYETLPKSDASQGVTARLKQNILVGILSDLSPRSDAVPVKFFGRTAGATRGPAVFALRAGAPVIPAFSIRLEDRTRHKLIIEEPLKLIRTGDISEDVARNTQLFQSVIERYVRRYPEQWLWMQKRWKIRSYLKRKIEKKQA
jgi:KDO2-lipid IV(A) lauroyltransferase